MTMQEIPLSLNGEPLRIAIALSCFNETIGEQLLRGALRGLICHGVKEKNIIIARVPGACELPLLAQTFALQKKYDAIICLGAVIRGATPHFDYVVQQAASGILKISLEQQIPIISGLLTTDTIEQAHERAGGKMGNKGFDAAISAIETANTLKQLY